MLAHIRVLVLGLLATATTFAAEPPPLTDFSRELEYDEAKISPGGTHLAAIVFVQGRRHLALVDLTTMKAVSVRPREADELATFDWVSDTRLVYTLGLKLGGIDKPVPTGELFGVNSDGGGASLLYGFRASGMQTGSKIKQVTAERGSARIVSTLRGNDDDILVAIDSWDSGKEGDFSELARMDARTGKRQTLTKAPMRAANFLADNEGRPRFAFGDDTGGKLQVYYRGVDASKWEMVLDERSSNVRSFPIAFSRDNATVYWKCASGESVGALCTWTEKERELKPIWKNKSVELDSLITSYDGFDVVGVRAMSGRPSLDPLVKGDPTVKTIISIMQQFPGDDVSIVSRTEDGKKVVVLVDADVNPGAYYLYDRDASKLELLVSRASWIKPDQLGAMEPIELKARDGLVLHGYLTRPPGKETAKNLPLVVMPHGGPHFVRDRWTYTPEVQALATRGYAVLQINFRGSGGYGFGFQQAGYREWGAKMQDDVTDATRWAIANGAADPKRICIFGASYGGYAALQGAVREPDLYRCAIGAVGVYDLSLFLTSGDISDSVGGANYLKEVLGDDSQQLAQRSPINQLDRLKAKVMLIVGGEDRRVPPVQGENLHNALVRRKVEHEWLYKANEGHGFYKENNRGEMLQKIIAFLDANIGAKH